jgi:hypothetical protein
MEQHWADLMENDLAGLMLELVYLHLSVVTVLLMDSLLDCS